MMEASKVASGGNKWNWEEESITEPAKEDWWKDSKQLIEEIVELRTIKVENEHKHNKAETMRTKRKKRKLQRKKNTNLWKNWQEK